MCSTSRFPGNFSPLHFESCTPDVSTPELKSRRPLTPSVRKPRRRSTGPIRPSSSGLTAAKMVGKSTRPRMRARRIRVLTSPGGKFTFRGLGTIHACPSRLSSILQGTCSGSGSDTLRVLALKSHLEILHCLLCVCQWADYTPHSSLHCRLHYWQPPLLASQYYHPYRAR